MTKQSKRPLIIVESPTKARTISRFMKAKYDVKASMGHVRDLPKSKLGVDIENGFKPQYITIRGKGKVIKELKEAAKQASDVYLATDPDREGEAISWHLCHVLDIEPQQARRVTFHEITENAVKEAFRNPMPIKQSLVDAQQARRILDRLVGYTLSPLLWKKVKPGLSAGRVQSAALRLIVDREIEIETFQPEEYWTIEALLQGEKGLVKAKYYGYDGKKRDLRHRQDVDQVLQGIEGAQFIVTSVQPKERRKNPPLPFTTSTLQQEASRKLGFTVRKTMSVAQTLYEGVELGEQGYAGLITYMRTDSTRVSPVAVKEARQYIEGVFGKEYIGRDRKRKSAPGAQDAHEAIRPTEVRRLPSEIKKYLTEDQYKLYELIWNRFVASQMAAAVYDTVTCDIEANKHVFRATGSRLAFPGFTKLYEEGEDNPEEPAEEIIPLSVNERLELKQLDPQQHFTQPPQRYTEASLVKTLEQNGIGRPSTYAPIIATLTEREYVVREKRRLVPTELGRLVDSILREHFPSIVDVGFTADMEKRLDAIEAGSSRWEQVIGEFWEPFKEQLEKAEQQIQRVKLQDELAGEDCEKCGRPMVIKRSRYGKFIACSGYPECKNTKPYVERTGAVCPRCKGDIVVRRSRKGRVFYGCLNYPDCDFVSWSRPVPDKSCPVCGCFLVEARGRSKGYRCGNPECSYTEKS
ncbi:MAG: type I DNA topoisomerase [Bacillota bacterium]|jgi:DNA topoisomerase-1|nr:type I DNA topoisomerase [Candidatus Fermentithermobacillaceae bacterium]HOA71230.1 type I DNA topoisomerase [Bacillota bacterium]HOP70134.1 type I DNA topoisomerase [Bacillota bacterium]HPT35084.1 type I DNA topoisomerase [Bacillota bacterium]HQD86262.1 type I DNA topoisomerase [Bacillota bacterium]